MISRSIISANGNASISHTLNVGALSGSTLIISDNADSNTSLMAIDNSIGKVIIGKSENANNERFLSHTNILTNTVNVLLVGEEHAVQVARLRLQKIVSHHADHLAQVGKDFLIIIVGHFGSGNIESEGEGLLAHDFRVTIRHFAKCARNVSNVHITEGKVFGRLADVFDLSVGNSDFG
jgi:hypothetical protein